MAQRFIITCRAEKVKRQHGQIDEFQVGDEVLVAQCLGCGHIAVYQRLDALPVESDGSVAK